MYKLIIRTLIDMCSKASYTDHYKLLFDKPKEEDEEKKKMKMKKKKKKKEKRKKKHLLTCLISMKQYVC